MNFVQNRVQDFGGFTGELNCSFSDNPLKNFEGQADRHPLELRSRLALQILWIPRKGDSRISGIGISMPAFEQTIPKAQIQSRYSWMET
ncbi:hypothetical protein SAMN02745206_01791 [Desulfacinum infernum DSM 9756]|uniref:Uncharacterized protein n=1 Tax=Desulfacinum infernum DSM 9756 TaxID=1121391 RepID=A0A1M5AUC9_9BACT|nr:hypothetical protein SAMN02745206_01791 [Desulfacinum infernum DSM 9756]